MSNFPSVYQFFGPVGQQACLNGPAANTRDWMVPGGLTSSNTKLFLFGSYGGMRRNAHNANFKVVMSAADADTAFRLVWIPTDVPMPPDKYNEIAVQRADSHLPIGEANAHPYGIDITVAWNKLRLARKDVYLMWQMKDNGTVWHVWEAKLEVFWTD